MKRKLLSSKYQNIQRVVQSNLNFKKDFESISNACMKFGIPFQSIESIPFSTATPEFNRDKQSIFYGSITLGNLVMKDKSLEKGLFLNDNFLMNNYIKQWGNYVLNSIAHITTIENLANSKEYKDNDELFIRPNDDNKLFAGEVMSFKVIKEWANKIKLLNTEHYSNPIVVSKPYNIESEWRLWIVNGKVITASKYREYFKTKKEKGCPNEVIKFAEERCKEYTPHDVFVMDICLCGDTYYIIECNCMNNAGFYYGDIETIVKEVSDYFIQLKNYMTDEEREELLHRIDQEGFDYCFMSYSAFKEIKDEKFHQLREDYQKAHAKLFTYIDLGIDLDNL